MSASLSEELKNVKWGEYKLSELFESGLGNYDIQTKHINGKGVYVVSAGLANNGIIGKTDVDATVFPPGTITVDMFGNAFYRNMPYKMVTHARVFALIPRNTLSYKLGCYFASSLSFLKKKFGYDLMCSWERIKDIEIKLPQTDDGTIDNNYMESFITKMETERLLELKEHLIANRLYNCELSDSEKLSIRSLQNGEFNFAPFKYCTIFNKIAQGRRLKKDDQLPGDIPFIMSGASNNGVANYVSNPVAIFPKNSITVDIFGNCFYHSYAFGAGDDNGVYWNTLVDYSPKVMLFFTTAMEKSIHRKYSYGQKLRSSRSHNLEMMLPVVDEKPDFALMETLITALLKLATKEVVQYLNKKLQSAH